VIVVRMGQKDVFDLIERRELFEPFAEHRLVVAITVSENDPACGRFQYVISTT
jgi:hypothetical protein